MRRALGANALVHIIIFFMCAIGVDLLGRLVKAYFASGVGLLCNEVTFGVMAGKDVADIIPRAEAAKYLLGTTHNFVFWQVLRVPSGVQRPSNCAGVASNDKSIVRLHQFPRAFCSCWATPE